MAHSSEIEFTKRLRAIAASIIAGKECDDEIAQCANEFGSDPDSLRSKVGMIVKANASLAKGNGHDVNGPVKFKLHKFNEIGFNPNRPYVVKGVLPTPSLAVFWGKPKCGKTFFALDLAMFIATGNTFFGKRVTKGHVVYCALEGKSGISKRLEAFRQYKLAQMQCDEAPEFSLMVRPLTLVNDHERLVSEISKQLGENKPAAIFIDTLNRSIGGSENEDKVMTAYLSAASAVMESFQCAVIIIHHCVHSDDHPRGHSSILGNCDVIIKVSKDAASGISTAKVEYSKDEDSGIEFAFKLRTVELGIDDEGDQITSCVVDKIEGSGAVEKEADRRMESQAESDWRLLQAVTKHPGKSQREYAADIGRSRHFVEQSFDRLKKDRLVNDVLGRWEATPKGKKQLAEKRKQDEDNILL